MGHEYIKEQDTFNTSRNGAVPKPSAADVSGNKVLQADGTWVAQSGGGGGTSDYNDLSNKPQINGHTLSGNQSAADLGINIPTKTSDLQNDSGFITTSATPGLIKNDGTIDTNTYALASSLATVATTGDYDDLLNKPTIPEDIGLSIVNGKICQTFETS